MSREINKDFICDKTIQITKTATTEIIDRIEESKSESCIRVKVVYKDLEGEILKSDNYSIIGEKYDMIMSDCPSFAPAKPSNEYREVDLWYMIDLIRNGQ